MIRSFIMGALVGGAAVWLYREEMQHYLDDRTRSMRERAAHGLESMEKTAETVLDEAKTQISSNLRAGREAIKP